MSCYSARGAGGGSTEELKLVKCCGSLWRGQCRLEWPGERLRDLPVGECCCTVNSLTLSYKIERKF